MICLRQRLALLLPMTLLCIASSPCCIRAHAQRVVAWGAGRTNAHPADLNDFGQSMVPPPLTDVVSVRGGWRHSLALKGDGTLVGWGDDSFGQTDFPTTNTYTAIACGQLHSLALTSTGQVIGAGDGEYGQVDVPATLSNVVKVACGFYHSLAIKSDGTVVAWGMSTKIDSIGTDPNYGQCAVPGDLTNVVAIAGGGWHSLALLSDGTVRAWGRNDYGQNTIPEGLTNVVAISAGAAHSLALKNDGTVVAWGQNIYGQTNVPDGLSNVVAIAAGGWHNLALKADGTITAWGAAGTNTNVVCGQNLVPDGLNTVVEIAAGQVHSLALVTNWQPKFLPGFSKATYNGLFADYTNGISSASAGSFKISTTAKGTFSGSLQLGSIRYSLSGVFGSNGIATNKPATNGKRSLSVSLRISTADSDQISGSLSTNGQSWTATLCGERAVYDGKTAKAPQQGLYIIVVPGNPDPTNNSTPGGDSFGTISVDKSGNVHLAESLADGTKTTQAAVVSTSGWWPLYAPLYSGQGLLWSWLAFSKAPAQQLQNEQLAWIKPPVPHAKYYPRGFTVLTNVLASAYARTKALPISAITNADLELAGAGFPLVSLPTTNYASGKARGAGKASLSFNLNTGTFSGSAIPGGKKAVSVSGGMLTNSATGYGFFLGTNGQSGRVRFTAR